jgi:pullulanase/glycogen debranching enzyme
MKDAIIYELHVEGFTAGGGSSHRHRGTYSGLVETGTTLSTDRNVRTGLDHLKELGVTHVQLMPVSEYVPAPGSKGDYDWGYWPLAWMSPRGDLASTEDGDAQLREFKQMVQDLHAAGIGVIVDLPLAQLSVQSSVEAISPGAFTFWEANGRPATIADQAYRIDSSASAARALMLQTVKFWMEEMGVDGVRIEALGHIDKTTAEEILATARSVYPAALVYVTPWGTGPSPHGQTTDKAALAGTGVAAYNDDYRNVLNGQSSGNSTGFVQEPRRFARNVEGLIAGSIGESATSSNHVLNLITDHDGCTLWDKLATTGLPPKFRSTLHESFRTL